MEEKCACCKESLIVPSSIRLLGSHVVKMKLILETITFDKGLFIGSKLCKVCWKIFFNFHDFKLTFIVIENQLKKNITKEQMTLYQALVSIGKIAHFTNIETSCHKACRICFTALKEAEYRDLKTCEPCLSKALTDCFPNIDITLTTDTDICETCYHKLLHYACFIQGCKDFIKSQQHIKEVCVESDNNEPLEKKSKLDKDETSLSVDTGDSNNDEPLEKKPKDKDETSSSDDTGDLDNDAPLEKKPKLDKDEILVSDDTGDSDNDVPLEKKTKLDKNEILVSDDSGDSEGDSDNDAPLEKKPKLDKDEISVSDDTGDSDNDAPLGKKTKLDTEEILVSDDSGDQETSRESPVAKADKVPPSKSIRAPRQAYQCNVCNEILYNKFSHKHTKTHSSTFFTCKRCSSSFYSFMAFSKHWEENHFSSMYEPVEVKRRRRRKDVLERIKRKTSRDQQRKRKMDKKKLNIYPKDVDIDDITEDQYYQCVCCLEPFKTKYDLLEHLKLHRKNQSTCLICAADFPSFPALRAHCWRKHGIKDLYRIVNYDSEDEPFAQKKDISHSPAPNAKNKSGIKVKTTGKHVRLKQSQVLENRVSVGLELVPEYIEDVTLDQYYECQCCQGNFRTKRELMDDIEHHAKNLKNCRVCGTMFVSFPILRKHLFEHGVKDLYKILNYDSDDDPFPQKEEMCHSSTTNAETVSETQSTEGTVSTSCPDCRQCFDSLNDYVSHCCQSKETTSESSPLQDDKAEEGLRCGHCSCVFYNFDDLEDHKCSRPLIADGHTEKKDDKSSDTSAPQVNLIKDHPKQPLSDSDLAEKKSKVANLKKRLRQHFLDKIKVKRRKKYSDDEKMAVIGKLAEMLGGKLEQDGDGGKKEVFECIGCHAGCLDETDLMFHMNYCRKVFRCTCCDYKAGAPLDLQLHSLKVHNQELYVCSNCLFMTLMVENYEQHLTKRSCFLKTEASNRYTLENDEIVNCSKSFKFSSISFEDLVEAVKKKETSQNRCENECKVEISDCDVDFKEEPCDSLDTASELQINDQIVSSTTPTEPEPNTKKNEDTFAMSMSTTVPDSSTSTPMNSHSHVEESEVFVIDSDSDSDTEFVESVETRISSVAAQAEEVCTVTASEASKLISEGIPVVTEANLIMMSNIQASNSGIMNMIADQNLRESSNEMIYSTTGNSETVSADSENGGSVFPNMEIRENCVNNYGNSILISDSEGEEDTFTEPQKNYELKNYTPCEKEGTFGEVNDGDNGEENSLDTSEHTLTEVIDENAEHEDEDEDEENQILAYTIIRNDKGGKTEAIQNGDKKLSTEEVPVDPEDDCTFMPQYTNVQVPCAKPSASSNHTRTRMTPTALQIFSSKVKEQMKKEYPNMPQKIRRKIALDAWRGLSETEKWPFREEARLNKKLFMQENPHLLPPPKPKVKKASVVPVLVSEDIEDPVLESEDIEEPFLVSEDTEEPVLESEDIEQSVLVSEDTEESVLMSEDTEEPVLVSEDIEEASCIRGRRKYFISLKDGSPE